MKLNDLIERAHRLADRYCIQDGKKFRLKDVDPSDTASLKAEQKPQAKEALQEGIEALAGLQEMLYAQDRWSVLLIFQAMDAAGKEQLKRFLSRLDEPEKNWKFSNADAHERDFWSDYMDAYQDMIQHTATKDSPWYVVPADNKWFTRIVVAAAVIDTLSSLNLHFPKVDAAKRKELAEVRDTLLGTE